MRGFTEGFEKVAALNLWKGRIRSGITPSVLKPAALPPKPSIPQPSARATQIKKEITPASIWRQALLAKK